MSINKATTLCKEVDVAMIAQRREERAARQRELISKYGTPVACITLNIAGARKYSLVAELCFNMGRQRFIETAFRFGGRLIHGEYVVKPTGCEAFLCIAGLQPGLLKALAVKLEESTDFGRLYDIDIIDTNGEKLTRSKARSCIICKEAAMVCSRSRAHSLEQIGAKTFELLRDAAAFAAADTAHKALVCEVETTPKAGLVDLANTGANSDMTVSMFIKSSRVLAPYFYAMAYCAWDGVDIEKLIQIGAEAEEQMLTVTGGVNTHRGAIFCIGLLCAAFSAIYSDAWERESPPTVDELAKKAGEIARLRKAPPGNTNGALVRRTYSGTVKSNSFGADAEARDGFPTALMAYYQINAYRDMKLEDNDCFALALVDIMAKLHDTNAYKRGGGDGAEYVRKRAEAIAALPVAERIGEIKRLDTELIEKDINCGGCADMLAAAIFMDGIAIITKRLDYGIV